MKRLFRWIRSWFKSNEKVEPKVEKKEPEFKLSPIPSQEMTENLPWGIETFLAPCPLINLEGRLIVAVNNGDKMLRRIVKVERPPIEGAIWTAAIEVIGAPKNRRTYERHCTISNASYAIPIMMDYEFNIHPTNEGICSNLIVIPFAALVRGYRLVEATKEDR